MGSDVGLENRVTETFETRESGQYKYVVLSADSEYYLQLGSVYDRSDGLVDRVPFTYPEFEEVESPLFIGGGIVDWDKERNNAVYNLGCDLGPFRGDLFGIEQLRKAIDRVMDGSDIKYQTPLKDVITPPISLKAPFRNLFLNYCPVF